MAVGIASFFLLLTGLSNTIPLRESILTSLSIQCLVIPYLYYNYFETPGIYEMVVDQYEYFGFMTPSFAMMGMGLFMLSNFDINSLMHFENKRELFRTGRNLIIIGLMGDLLMEFVPFSLRFAVKLIIFLKYIGAVYVLYSETRNKILWIALAFVNLFFRSAADGLFQDFLGWSMFFVLYFFQYRKVSFWMRGAILTLVMAGIIVLQQAKVVYRSQFRDTISQQDYVERVKKFGSQYVEVSAGDETFETETFEETFVRFNQGYIISRIMYNVPLNEPFANGETISDAIYGSIVPRFFDPNKTVVGGSNGLYTRFTGYQLQESTSMDLSIMGELYANFGVKKGIFGSFFVGLFYALVFFLLVKAAHSNTQLIFWVPYIFLIAVRAENGFTPVLNHMIKAIIMLYALYKLYLVKFRFTSFTSETQNPHIA